jgi:hypothetical protein
MPDFTPDGDAIRVGQGRDRTIPQPQEGPALVPPAVMPNPTSRPIRTAAGRLTRTAPS